MSVYEVLGAGYLGGLFVGLVWAVVRMAIPKG